MRALSRTAAAAVAALVILAALAGCGPATQARDAPPTAAPAPPAVVQQEGAPVPAGVVAPAIGLHSTTGDVMPLGVDGDGVVEVPPEEEPERLGWYEPGVTPGEVGPAVLLGHVNGGGRDGVFARAHELAPGDRVEVPMTDGSTVAYTVDRVQIVPKVEFPTADVYGDTDGPELRLVTCGGEFDYGAESYEDQVIVYASAA